jgi:hypothetical protein
LRILKPDGKQYLGLDVWEVWEVLFVVLRAKSADLRRSTPVLLDKVFYDLARHLLVKQLHFHPFITRATSYQLEITCPGFIRRQ